MSADATNTAARSKWATWETAAFFGMPVGLLIVSFVAVCVEAGTAWPWLAYVHESGDKTLLDTLLYYDHAARELPVDLVLGAAAAGAVAAHGRRPRPGLASTRTFVGLGALAVLLIIVWGTVNKVGWDGLGGNLSQLYTRPGTAPQWGAHFRYHFLSRLGLVLSAWWIAGLHRWLTAQPATRPGGRPFGLALAAFFVLTLIYIPSLEPFSHPHFLGHQAREAVTQALVTLPLALGACLLFAYRPAAEARPPLPRALLLVAALAAVLVLWTGLGAMLTGASDERQTDSVVAIVFVHVFEHGLGYLLTPLFAAWLFLLGRPAAP